MRRWWENRIIMASFRRILNVEASRVWKEGREKNKNKVRTDW